MTNGIVSVLEDGEVVLKVICGCDGYNASKLAKRLRSRKNLPTLQQTWNLALQVGFGCADCLVVQGTVDNYHHTGDDLSGHYLSTEHFLNPRFNPRRESGLCGRVCIVNRNALDKQKPLQGKERTIPRKG